jgi:DNA-binding transcriptional MerR regulator
MTKTQIERLAIMETKLERQGEDISEIKDTLHRHHNDIVNQITLLQDGLSKKVNDHEERLRVAEETIEPLTKFRRKVWYSLILTVLGIAFWVMVETKKLN